MCSNLPKRDDSTCKTLGVEKLAYDRPHWSYSAINQFLRCPRQFYFERILRLPRESTSSSLVFGSAVHSALAVYHQSLKENSEATTDEIVKAISRTWDDASEQKTIEFKEGETCQDLIALGVNLVELYRDEEPPRNIVHVEKRMMVPLHNSNGKILEKPLVAIADLITGHEGQNHITEFKTSGKSYSEFDIDNSLQATCYVNASYELLGNLASVDYVVFVRTKVPKIQRVRTARNEEELGKLGDIVEAIERAIEVQAFFPIVSAMNCSTCPYRQPCQDWKPNFEKTTSSPLAKLNGVKTCWPN